MANVLPTNFRDDVIDADQNEHRVYRMHSLGNDLVWFEDVTQYVTEGSQYGASEINAQNSEINNKVKLNGAAVNMSMTFNNGTLDITTS